MISKEEILKEVERCVDGLNDQKAMKIFSTEQLNEVIQTNREICQIILKDILKELPFCKSRNEASLFVYCLLGQLRLFKKKLLESQADSIKNQINPYDTYCLNCGDADFLIKGKAFCSLSCQREYQIDENRQNQVFKKFME